MKNVKRFTAIFLIAVFLTIAAAVPAMAFEPDKDPALKSYFSFDGTLGGAKVIDGLLNNYEGVDGLGKEAYAEGVHGQAFYFDGNTGLSLGTGLVKGNNFTIALWINPEVLTSHTTTFFAADPNNAPAWMSIVPYSWANEVLVWSNVESNAGFVWFDGFADKIVDPGEWVHIAVTVDGDNLSIYTNGKLVKDDRTTDFDDRVKNVALALSGGEANFFLGANNWDPPFVGKIDDVYTFNRTLSEAEIAELMNYVPSNEAPAEEIPVEEPKPEAGGNEPAPIAPPPVVSPPAVQTGDAGIITLAIVMIFASVGIVIIRRKVTEK